MSSAQGTLLPTSLSHRVLGYILSESIIIHTEYILSRLVKLEAVVLLDCGSNNPKYLGCPVQRSRRVWRILGEMRA